MGAKASGKTGSERRKSARKDILDSFQVFAVLPSLSNSRKIYLKDVSEGGVSFLADEADRIIGGKTLDLLLYINPTLNLPLQVKVAHVGPDNSEPHAVKVGCEFTQKNPKAYKAYQGFLNLLDELTDFFEESLKK
jgi:hypothetical protein